MSFFTEVPDPNSVRPKFISICVWNQNRCNLILELQMFLINVKNHSTGQHWLKLENKKVFLLLNEKVFWVKLSRNFSLRHNRKNAQVIH
jgi:hypothetical protein